MGMVGTAVVIAGVAYLVGSIPAAYVVGRMVSGVDMRVAGEGNVGARNAYHVVGRGWGGAVCLTAAAKRGAGAAELRAAAPGRLMRGRGAPTAGTGFPVSLGGAGGRDAAPA